MHILRRLRLLLVSVPLLTGCARLDYVKVPSPTQYSGWDDEQQRKADNMKGVRYYLPRPFLHLKQPIPVAQRVAFISFRRQGNGFVLELPENSPTWLARVAPKKLALSQALAALLVSEEVETAQPGPARQEADEGDATAPGDAAQPPPSRLTARTGYVNSADPVTHLGDLMDVVYLPDFEEQFVIRPRTGLGTADIETRLRNGWAAEVFSQQVDNSNLIPYIIRQVEDASEAAARIAASWVPATMGLPPGTTLPNMANLLPGGAQEEAADGTLSLMERLLADLLVFKIAEVRWAQPGIYPILKPREIRQWFKTTGTISGVDPEDTFELFLEQAHVPWVRPDMAYVPAPPFTMVGFNSTTDVFLAPATERINLSPPDARPENRDPQSTDAGNQQAQEKIRTALSSHQNDLKDAAQTSFGQQLDLLRLSATTIDANKNTRITISTKGATPLTADQMNASFFKAWIRAAFNQVTDDHITVTFPDNRNIEIKITKSLVDLAGLAKNQS